MNFQLCNSLNCEYNPIKNEIAEGGSEVIRPLKEVPPPFIV